MSSLAATQADGYYIPDEYYTSGAYKKKSISQFSGSKGHNQYLQRSVVRFELPFDGFCTKCDAIVGKGTRFNAHKAHVDDYFFQRYMNLQLNVEAVRNGRDVCNLSFLLQINVFLIISSPYLIIFQ